MAITHSPASLVGLAVFITVCYWVLYRKRQHPLPPGPPGLPILGNALQMKEDVSPWVTFATLGRRYGDVVHVTVLGQSIIALNSATAINDLLEKRSAIYSDRPRVVMVQELCGYGAFFSVSRYGERHRKSRHLFNRYIGPTAMVGWQDVQEQLARRLLSHLLESPDDWLNHIHLMAASVSIKTSIGVDVDSLDYPLVDLAERVMAEFLQAFRPGAWLVDSFPALKYIPEWFPGADFKRKAKLWHQTMTRLRDDPYDVVKTNLANGNVSPSLLSSALLDDTDLDAESEDIYKHVAGTAYAAAVDTTRATLKWFFLAMTLYPEAQKKAQAEIDRVIEPGRLPTFLDRSQLPYIEALLKEVYRWAPAVPMGLPHRVMEEDIYRQYRIPAGATIMGNAWAILHDPALYPNPDSFEPDRFLSTENGSMNPDPRTWAFGFGRRSCPGRYLADTTVWIAILLVLAAFNIEKPLDEDGNPIIPAIECEDTLAVSTPKTFKCRTSPRLPDLASLLGTI